MKKSNILFLVVIVVTIIMLLTMMDNVGTYEAFESSKTKSGQKVHVVGFYNKDKGVDYNPEKDPNSFTFYLSDTLGVEKQVKCYKEVPQDFEKSERVVVIGQLKADDVFHAEDLLLKCPSKYVDEEGRLRELPGTDGGN